MAPTTHSTDASAPALPASPIRVMIVDDSVVARRVLTRILQDDGRFVVTGSYSDADHAIAALRDKPVDMIILDLEMPGRTGVESLPDLLRIGGDPMVVILSGAHDECGPVALDALAKGAREVMTKPAAGHFGPAFACALAERLQAIFTGEDRISWTAGPAQRQFAPQGLVHVPRAVGIGASTGGVHALSAFLKALDGHAQAPIFITQHLPGDFLPFFAEQLCRQSRLQVQIAREGSPVLAGQVYLAPGDAHLTVRRSAGHQIEIRYSRAPSRHGAFPAVDPMLTSLAEVYGAGTCALIFSGMGRDGLSGAHAVVRAGGSVIAQDSTSSVVWGMPGAVVQAGLASMVVPPEDAARALTERWRIAA